MFYPLQDPILDHLHNFIVMIVEPKCMPEVRNYYYFFIFRFAELLQLKDSERVQYFIRSALNTQKWHLKLLKMLLFCYFSHMGQQSPCCRCPNLTCVHESIWFLVFLERVLCTMTLHGFHGLKLRQNKPPQHHNFFQEPIVNRIVLECWVEKHTSAD